MGIGREEDKSLEDMIIEGELNIKELSYSEKMDELLGIILQRMNLTRKGKRYG